jgi:uncharacterized protein (TIGR02145 family)
MMWQKRYVDTMLNRWFFPIFSKRPFSAPLRGLCALAMGFASALWGCGTSGEVCVKKELPPAVDSDGNSYPVVKVGYQVWFRENLRTQRYRNGDEIQGYAVGRDGARTTAGVQTTCDSLNVKRMGRLYNGYAVSDPRGLCPAGYHVPTKREWITLEQAVVDGDSACLGLIFDDGMPPDTLRDFGLNIPASGYRDGISDLCEGRGMYAWLWTSTAYDSANWIVGMYGGSCSLTRIHGRPQYGFSVRCIKDFFPASPLVLHGLYD